MCIYIYIYICTYNYSIFLLCMYVFVLAARASAAGPHSPPPRVRFLDPAMVYIYMVYTHTLYTHNYIYIYIYICIYIYIYIYIHIYCLHFSICACHPCAGAMLIFPVPFQFQRMIPEGNPYVSFFCFFETRGIFTFTTGVLLRRWTRRSSRDFELCPGEPYGDLLLYYVCRFLAIQI